MGRLSGSGHVRSIVLIAVVALIGVGCTPEPRVSEDFPEVRPWFSIEEVQIEESGWVQVDGRLIEEASEVSSRTTDATSAAAFPDHIAYGFWPEPTQVGPGDVVSVDRSGKVFFEYDFSRSDGVRPG